MVPYEIHCGDRLEGNLLGIHCFPDLILYLLLEQPFAGVGGLYLLMILANLAQSVVMSQLIQYTSDADAPIWWGLLLAALTLIAPVTRFLSENAYYFYTERIGMRVLQLSLFRSRTHFRILLKWRIATITLIYQKTLVISTLSKGNANNLLNVDPTKISNLCWQWHRVWAWPLQIVC